MKLSVTFFAFVLSFLFNSTSFAQQSKDLDAIQIDNTANAALYSNYLSAQPHFDAAYNSYPNIPKGMLEAISFHYTHFRHIDTTTPESCVGLPRVYGIMGLTLDGKNYFRNNLLLVSSLSGYTVNQIIDNPQINVLAYAAAFDSLRLRYGISSQDPLDYKQIFIDLSELNIDSTIVVNDYAMSLYLYEIFGFLNNSNFQSLYSFPKYEIDLESFFGTENYHIITDPFTRIDKGLVKSKNGSTYKTMGIKVACPDYPFSLCNWVASTNFSSRSGTAISNLVMHTVQGSYTGCISWFQNTSANASTQYVVASNSVNAGKICQMVLESDKAWHVTTENPYTIGYEHEGYVDDVSWYTSLMYQISADLSKDICTQYSINTKRTFFADTLDNGTAHDYGLYDLGGVGGCVKIRGHQHYVNQTHTDPGPFWHWNYYYKLMNAGTAVTTYTASSGTFTDTGGASADYSNDERKLWLIQPTGASSVSLTFTAFDLEDNWDYMYIYNGTNEYSPLIGRYNTTSPGTVTATSGSMLIEFRSDCSTTALGWSANWTSVQPDAIAPTTSISVNGTWQTQDFTANFTDADNVGGSGLEKSFYQVLEYDGSNWGANYNNGFFADNFDAYNSSLWTVPASSGTWVVNSGNLIQSDTTVNNGNIYAPLNQNLSNRYIYQFYAKIDAATYTTNQHRFGFHFFSDNASLTNRNNSYFIFFRQETSKLEFYKVINDVFTQVNVVDNVTTTFGQWYDIKVIFDRISGKIDVYRDNVFLGSWTDTSVLTNQGNYISFRTGNCKAYISEIKVYRSRFPSVTVTVGSASTNDIRVQNPNPSTFAAKIKSIVNDVAGNLSSIAYQDLNIDFTPPTSVSVYDGVGADIDTTNSLNTLYANWTSSADANSGIAKYYYAVGSTPGATNILNWTLNSPATNTNATITGLSLVNGQTYYVSVKAENGAGLQSTVATSDGIYVANIAVAAFISSPSTACVGSNVNFTNQSQFATSYSWVFDGGTPATSTAINPIVVFGSAGQHSVSLTATGPGGSNTSTQQVTVYPNANADFSVNSNSFTLPSALALFTNNSTNASSYLWTFGDGNSSTDVSPWNNYLAAGDYTVTLIAYNTQCANDTLEMTNYIHVEQSVGINENVANSSIILTPNPFNTDFDIVFPDSENKPLQIIITDVSGKVVYEARIQPNTSKKHKISLASLASGIYLLELTGETSHFREKLIKK